MSASSRPPHAPKLGQSDATHRDTQGDTHSTGGIRRDVVAAFVLALMVAVAGLFLIVAFVWTSRAFAEVNVADGEVSINGGEVYAGDGCVRAGDIVVGDCEDGNGAEGGEGEGDSTEMSGMTTPRTTSGEDESTTETTQESTALEATSSEETTSEESTSGETTSSEPSGSPGETTTEAVEGSAAEDVEVEDAAACPAEPTGATREATVKRAVDGDTFEISNVVEGTYRVRLIGVDSPEMNVDAEEGGEVDEKPEPGAEEAARFTADALEGEDVTLELGEESTDDYGRLLAYVWTGSTETGDTATRDAVTGDTGAEDTENATSEAERAQTGADEQVPLLPRLARMVGMDTAEGGSGEGGGEARSSQADLFNAALLEAGHAGVLTVPPNDAYAPCFEAIEERGGRGGADEEQYAPSDEQYAERTAPEATTAERTTAAPERATIETTEPTETTRTVEETALTVEETTQAPEESTPTDPMTEETTTQTTTQPADEQYEEQAVTEQTLPEQTVPEQTVPEQTVPEETAQPTTQRKEAPAIPEETVEAPAPGLTVPETTAEQTTEAQTAPPAAITLDPPPATEGLRTSGDEKPVAVGESPSEEPADSYKPPSEVAVESGSLPTVETAEGPVAVLPDTGGPANPFVLAFAFASVLGGAYLLAGCAGLLLPGAIRRRCFPEQR